MQMSKYLAAACFMACLFNSQSLLANDSIYEQRRLAYINNSLNTINNDVITIQAYANGAADTALINELINRIPTKSTSDFDLVKLVRVLFLTNGTQDSLILPGIENIPYWLTKGDTLRGYWSENHMIMWMSCNFLLKEKYGFAADTALETRLKHYLNLKIKYGFYEFFSPVYAPFSLSGLLNLADFAQDPQIKSLATQAAVRLLKDLLLVTNDKGVMFAVAGRSFYSKYDNAYDENHSSLIYLLTGMGDAPTRASHSGGFLATSTLQVDSIVSSWKPLLDTTYYMGHSLDSGLILNSSQRTLDKTIFTWSSGGYFHPTVAFQTAQLLTDSMIWFHVDFEAFRIFSTFSPQAVLELSESVPAVSMSTVISGQQVSIFKQNQVTLSSLNNFWPGKVSYQQYPCMANVGTTAVYTASGIPTTDWYDRNSDNSNDHLPYITQEKNVALLMYRPEPNNILLKSTDVALHFKDADFDEVRNDSLWLLGREGNGYVAVRRSCVGQINNERACAAAEGQSWVIVVGDSSMYGTFDDFEDVILQAQFSEEWYNDSLTNERVYYASVTVDSIELEYAWRRDLPSGIEGVGENNTNFKVYPNPTDNVVNIAFENPLGLETNIQVTNMLGQVVHTAAIEGTQVQVQTQDWPDGVYLIMVEQQGTKSVERLVKY